jgi:hypothetical protein
MRGPEQSQDQTEAKPQSLRNCQSQRKHT